MYVYIYLTFLNPFISWRLFTHFVFAVVNKTVMNVGVQMSFWDTGFISFGSISRSGYGGLHVVVFLIFWGTSYVFYNNLTNLNLDNIQRCFFFFSTSSPVFVIFFFLIADILTSMRWQLIMVLFAFPWGLVVLNISIQRKKGKFKEKIEIFWMV